MARHKEIQNPVWTVYIVQAHVYVATLPKEVAENDITVVKWYEGDDAEAKAKAYAFDFIVATQLPAYFRE